MKSIELSADLSIARPFDLFVVDKERYGLVVDHTMIPFSYLKPDLLYVWEVFDGTEMDLASPQKVSQIRELRTYIEVNLRGDGEILHHQLRSNPLERRTLENEKMHQSRCRIARKVVRKEYPKYCNDTYLSYLPWGSGTEVWPLKRVKTEGEVFSTVGSAYPESGGPSLFRDYSVQFILDIYQKMGLVQEWTNDKSVRGVILRRLIKGTLQVVHDTEEKEELPENEV